MKVNQSTVMLHSYVKIALLVLIPLFSNAQQIQLNTPFVLNRNMINPSYDGALDFHQFDFFMGSKQKWNGVVPGAPTVNVFHAMAKFTDKHSVGVQLIEHNFATFNYKAFAIPYSFTAKINDNHSFKLGLSPRFIQSTIDFSNAITEMTIEPAKDDYSRLTVFIDATAGISYHYKNRIKIGASMSNFLVNGSANDPDMLNYSQYSILQGLFDVQYVMLENNISQVSIDALCVTNGTLSPSIQAYVTGSKKFSNAAALMAIGYKSTGEFVTIIRLQMPKFYYLYSYEIPISGNQLSTFTGNYVGLGYRFGALRN